MSKLTFEELCAANVARQAEWDPSGVLSLTFKATELAGEIGEACNIIKKIERERLGLPGKRATVEQLAEELADSIICLSLIAANLNINLSRAVREKFNNKSAELGLETKL